MTGRAMLEDGSTLTTWATTFAGHPVQVAHSEGRDGEWVEITFTNHPDARLTLESTTGPAAALLARLRGRLERRAGLLV